MEAYIARQPIFDADETVFAYELLFRSGLENAFSHDDPDEASAKVMADGSLLMGLETLTGGKPAFINATRDILLNDYFHLLPKEFATVEVLEDVEPDMEVITACMRLKKAGYMLALDDFIYREELDDLIHLADIIKVDFLATVTPEERKAVVEKLGPIGVRFLAEKVETREEFEQAAELGYEYFQGYFFSKPVIVTTKSVPAFKLNYMRIVREVQRPELNFTELDAIVKLELSLTYKLLRYINSAYFGLRNKVSSIKHAIVMLGEREFRKWISFVALAGMGEDKPDELVVESLIRAKFCEALAHMTGLTQRSEELFLLGMFSLLDAIMDQPFEQLLVGMPMDDDLKAALMGTQNRLKDVLDYAVAYGRGDWEQLEELADKLKMDGKGIPALHLQTVRWAERSLAEVKGQTTVADKAGASSRR